MLTKEGWLKHWQIAVEQSLKAHLTLLRGEGVNLGPQRECPGSWDSRGFQVLARICLGFPCNVSMALSLALSLQKWLERETFKTPGKEKEITLKSRNLWPLVLISLEVWGLGFHSTS